MRTSSSRKQPDPARWSTNFANLTNLADLALKLRMIFRTIKRTSHIGRTAIYRRMRRSADVEFSELIKFNVDLVLWTSFTLRLDLFGLWRISTAFQCGLWSAKPCLPDPAAWPNPHWQACD